MKRSELSPGQQVQIRVCDRLQTATVVSVTQRTQRSYDYRPDRVKWVVRLSYTDPQGRARSVERSPAACRPLPGSTAFEAAKQRAAKAAAKPRRPELYDVSREHAMVPFGGPDGVVARARRYVAAVTAYHVARGTVPKVDVRAAQRAWIKDCLARHWRNRAMYLAVQTGRISAPETACRHAGRIAERAARQAFSDPMRVAMMGRATLASWVGYQVTGHADGYRSM
jgi:hypothetical protein